jgi:hypothetical protein
MTTATKDYEVIDSNGKRVRRDGILQDGDVMVTRMTMMDGSPHPSFGAAAALAEAVKRNERFDASHGVGYKPGYSTQDAGPAGFTAREARDAKMRDAWKNPAPVIVEDKANKPPAVVLPTASDAELAAARDAAVAARDKRTEAAWHH